MCSEAADPCGTFPARSFCFAGYFERRENALLTFGIPTKNKKRKDLCYEQCEKIINQNNRRIDSGYYGCFYASRVD